MVLRETSYSLCFGIVTKLTIAISVREIYLRNIDPFYNNFTVKAVTIAKYTMT